jgi:hypothetical protein
MISSFRKNGFVAADSAAGGGARRRGCGDPRVERILLAEKIVAKSGGGSSKGRLASLKASPSWYP